MYMINGALKFAEVDDYKKGCLPETATMFDVDINFKADTKEGIINKLKNFYYTSDENFDINACGENGRIDVFILENAEGMEASEREIEEWKKGKCKLWSAVYTHQVYKMEEVIL